jgi:cytidylate kinase
VIVEGRLAGWTIDADLKIWLKTPLRVRAERIAKREEIPVHRAYDETETRQKCEILRYKTFYEIDLTDLSCYDLIIDTSKWDARRLEHHFQSRGRAEATMMSHAPSSANGS